MIAEHPLFVATVLMFFAAACTPNADSRHSASFRDSAGTRIVESHVPAWAPGEEWRVGAEPLLQIGHDDSDPSHQFTQIVGLKEFPNGYIAAANFTHPPEVRVFDSLGGHVATVGGEGEGPGEFRTILRLWIAPPDTIIVFDPRVSRLTYFGVSGEVFRTTLFNPVTGGPSISADVGWWRHDP